MQKCFSFVRVKQNLVLLSGKKVNYATHPDWVPSLNMKPAQIDSAIGSVVKKEHIQEASRRSINTLG